MMKAVIYICIPILIFLLLGEATLAQSPTPTPEEEVEEEEETEDEEDENTTEKEEELRGEIDELEDKISELQEEQESLSSQIEIVDSQVALSELRVQNTRNKIAQLQEEIGITEEKIGDIEGSMSLNTQALINRAVAIYESGKVESWQILLTSDSVSNFLRRLAYLKIIQENDKKALLAAEQAKVNYSNQQNILGEKVDKEIELEEELEQYNNQLEEDRQKKEDLLAVTKNSEEEYQARLADALRELQQISDAAKILISTEPRTVSRGEPIGLMGNTGYSFGAHLHFGIYNIDELEDYNYYSNHENPLNSLENQSVSWGTSCSGDPTGMSASGDGSFAWPMQVSGLRVTQGYGVTCYSDVYYNGRPHPALDIVNNSNIVVRATEEGEAYFCQNCTGDGANGVFVFHDNGKMSLYWHLQ